MIRFCFKKSKTALSWRIYCMARDSPEGGLLSLEGTGGTYPFEGLGRRGPRRRRRGHAHTVQGQIGTGHDRNGPDLENGNTEGERGIELYWGPRTQAGGAVSASRTKFIVSNGKMKPNTPFFMDATEYDLWDQEWPTFVPFPAMDYDKTHPPYPRS